MSRPTARQVQKVRWAIRKVRGGWDGTILIPAGRNGLLPVTVFQKGPRRGKRATKAKASAISSAAKLASRIADNPVLRAALPPGTSAAIKGIGMLARYTGAGAFAKGMGKLIGKGASRLVKALKFW